VCNHSAEKGQTLSLLTPAKLNFLNKLKQILAKVNLKLKANTTLFHTQKTPLVLNNIKEKETRMVTFAVRGV